MQRLINNSDLSNIGTVIVFNFGNLAVCVMKSSNTMLKVFNPLSFVSLPSAFPKVWSISLPLIVYVVAFMNVSTIHARYPVTVRNRVFDFSIKDISSRILYHTIVLHIPIFLITVLSRAYPFVIPVAIHLSHWPKAYKHTSTFVPLILSKPRPPICKVKSPWVIIITISIWPWIKLLLWKNALYLQNKVRDSHILHFRRWNNTAKVLKSLNVFIKVLS